MDLEQKRDARRSTLSLAFAPVLTEESQKYYDKLVKSIIEWSRLLECGITDETEMRAVSQAMREWYAKLRSSTNQAAPGLRFRRHSAVTKIEIVAPTEIQTIEDELLQIVCSIGFFNFLKYAESNDAFRVAGVNSILQEQKLVVEQLPSFINAALVSALTRFWDLTAKLDKAKRSQLKLLKSAAPVAQADAAQTLSHAKGIRWADIDEETVAKREMRNDNIRLLSIPTEARNAMIAGLESFCKYPQAISPELYDSVVKKFKNWCDESHFSENTPLLGPDKLAHTIAKLEAKLTIAMCNLVLLIKSAHERTSSLALITLANTADPFSKLDYLFETTKQKFCSILASLTSTKLKRRALGVQLRQPHIVGEPKTIYAKALLSAAKSYKDF